MNQSEGRIEVEIKDTQALDYLIAVPKDYDKDGDPVPLVLFMHGSGERGDNLALVKKNGPPKMIAQGHDFGAIVVSPQCPAGMEWGELTEVLLALLDQIEDAYNVDEDRVYVTGLSLGGYGTFALCAKAPRRFAAAVPVCGGGSFLEARRLTRMSMWVFHGDADRVVPVDESRRMVNYMNAANGRLANLTVYEGVGHNSWDRAYASPLLWTWLLQQKRGD